MNISKETKQKNVKYIVNEIEHTCKTFGDRDPGGEGEAKAAEYMAKSLKKYSDEVKTEAFDVYPKSFLGWIPYTLSSVMLGYIASFFLPIAAIALVAFGMTLLACRLLFYTDKLDKLFKKKTSHNVTAVKHPTGEVTRRIFFNGHVDAAWEWPIAYHLGGAMNTAIPILAMVGAGAVALFSLVRMCVEGTVGVSIASGAFLYIGLALAVFVPIWVLMFFFANLKKTVPGANDNLTSCYLSIALMKALQESGIQLEHTEIGTLITGSEEAGLRGARAWAKKHNKDYNEVETIIITMETLREAEFLSVFYRDMNGFFSADKGVVELLKRAGIKSGVKLGNFSVTAGATDAIGFCQNGFKSACLGGLDHNLKAHYYHTRNDNYDNLSPDCLAKAMEVAFATIEIFDKEGLPKV